MHLLLMFIQGVDDVHVVKTKIQARHFVILASLSAIIGERPDTKDLFVAVAAAHRLAVSGHEPDRRRSCSCSVAARHQLPLQY